jgi:hypothetical protein
MIGSNENSRPSRHLPISAGQQVLQHQPGAIIEQPAQLPVAVA